MRDILIQPAVSRNSMETEKLVHIWEQSVKATHLFLTETDIAMLIPDVKLGLEAIDKLIVAKDQLGEPLGFMGVANRKIEMLFISPEYFGRGIGTLLINYAISVLDANLVDVNEQNPKALGFYKHSGFEVYDRSEIDEQGRPFPILHMKLTQSTSIK
ncbi:Peptidyl-lysine N-acetyltransferase YjaB [Sporomusa rhizae]|uniref:GNAT family N-acetyltransferase n=1 Tax=Sporomusa rhizae TaxID=357999 RepID=UPI00352B1A36